MIRRSVALVLLVTCGALACAQTRGSGFRDDRDRDLEQLAEWVSKEQSFTEARGLEAQRAIAGHRENATRFTEAGFYMEVCRIVGLADNGHSNVTRSPVHNTFGLLPLRTYWFSDGLYVVRARKPHEHLLGARIDAVNGKTIADLEAPLMDYHSGSTALFRRFAAPSMMLSPTVLHAIGLSKSPDRLTLKMTSRAGEPLEVTLDVDRGSSSVRERPWRYLHPEAIDGEDDWVTIHANAAKLPMYLQEREERFRYVLIEDGTIAYIQLRANIGSGGVSVRDFAAKTRKRLEQDLPRSIILDNRQNPGGDLGRTADFALALPSLAQPDGKVYVITGSGTFSAGIYTSFYPKAADAERTVVVGEHVGDWPRFWAETGAPFRLPDSGYGIGYALKMHDLAEGCHDTDVCHLSRSVFDKRWNIAVGSLEPDWPVATNFADYEAGRDRPLERILQDATEHRTKLGK